MPECRPLKRSYPDRARVTDWRRSHERTREQAALQLVIAWADANHLILDQVAVADDASELTAIPLQLTALAMAAERRLGSTATEGC